MAGQRTKTLLTLEADLLENREDRATSLVLSDLYQEMGDPRGMLIALDEAYKRSESAHDAKVTKRHYDAFLADAVGELLFDGAERLEPGFRNGQLESVTFKDLRDLERVLEHPCSKFIRELRWEPPNPEEGCRIGVEPLLKAVSQMKLEALSVEVDRIEDEVFGEEGTAAITSCKDLAGLRRLELIGVGINAGVAEHIANSRTLKSLEELDLAANWIGDDGAESLARSRSLRGLEELNISLNGITCEGAIAIAESQHLKSIRRLRIGNNAIGDSGAIAIAENMGLRSLGIGDNQLSGKGLAAIVGSEEMGGLEELEVRNQILGIDGNIGLEGPNGAERIAGAFRLGKLRKLDLSGSHLSEKGAQVLGQVFKNLEELHLSSSHLGDEGVFEVVRSAKRLRVLNLAGNGVRKNGAQEIAMSGNMRFLEKLNLRFNYLGDEGAEMIAASENLGNLKELDLLSNNIGPLGSKALEKSEKLTKLETVKLFVRLDLSGDQKKEQQCHAL